MRSFENYNPIVVALYFLLTSSIIMFSQNPILLLTAFVGAVSYFLIRNRENTLKTHLFFFIIFIILTLINPLTSHNGRTVLFFINDSPITLEATVFGAVSAGIIVTVLYLFKIFSSIMTRDRLLYVFGKLSPKVALILSMGIRYIALFKERTRKIVDSQRALGLYKDDNLLDKIKCDLRVFSILITWALENGIITANSMEARGYGKQRRTHYSLFKFRSADIIILSVTLLCSAVTLTFIFLSKLDFVFYPTIKLDDLNLFSISAYISYGILSLLPTFNEIGEKLKWSYLQSKI
ncbi:MAG: energy-coupling factor transporter transmembrane protein EcfT [Ruminococcaceae bacterium]|nr:energy-coupling factor transporter transmembrane protein EcfT [Oscillospiraceae bacterium]